MLPRYPSKSKDRKSKPLYKIVDNTIVRIPNEFIRITLLPIEDEQDIVWKNDWILSKANKSLQKLLFSLWIPSIYLDPHTVKQNEELLMMYNGGRTSDIIIPTFETEYHGVKYYFNILNCKGTGNLEMIGIMNKGRFLITDAHITRIEYMNGTPLGAVSLDDALNEEVVNENLMLENGLPHTPHALVLKIPREIQKRID
ncbi:MAG: hypothetical protein QXP04_04475, partial [Candidatus Nanoarchaeia archaeon]|nr:hypothetical protein [Candidatus Jingweiarchaeum tengchongense]